MVVNSIEIEVIKKEMLRFIDGNRIYICGVSVMGKTLAEWMDKNNIRYEAFVDRKGEADWTKKSVLKYEEIPKVNELNCRYIITQKFYKKEVEEELIRTGVKKEQILMFANDATFDSFYYDLIEDVVPKNRVDKRFYNIYEGERCFVVGNGPSLKEEDIIKIRSEKTFAVNMMYENFERLDWNPSFYVVNDKMMSTVFEENQNVFYEVLEKVKYFLLEEKTGLFRKYVDEDIPNLYFFRDTSQVISTREEYLFSEDIERCVYRGQTVLYVVLQFAIYMGFKEIYLIGVDNSFKKVQKSDGTRIDNDNLKRNHASFIKEPDWYQQDAYEFIDEMLLGYEAAKEYAEKHDIKIYNATRGGKLEVFPRVNFDELFD